MSVSKRSSVYDLLRPHLFADDLIKRLGLIEARRIGSEAYCRPLCHESTSGESLQVNLHTGRWNCKACQHMGVRGDLVQLVEYVLSGGRAPSHGSEQGSSPSHREAIVWLCQQFGIPFEEGRAGTDAALDVIHTVAMVAHEALLASPSVVAWIGERWGFDLATIESYGIGYLPSPLPPALKAEAEHRSSRDAFKRSGIGWFSNDGSWHTRFEGRVIFPYLEHGRAVYLIGRATPWTPALDGGNKPPKYHKLSVHSERRPYISERVTNDHLYNELVMSGVDAVIVAEGVADAVALSSLGAPVVSPVTISFNATDLERFTRKARENNIQRVEIIFDNELSGSGNWAARRVGVKLVERGIVTRILTLPLGPEQQAARDEVVRILGHEAFEELERSEPNDRKRIVAEAAPDEQTRAWLIRSIEQSKIDAAEWCAQQGAGAAGKFDAIRRSGADVIDIEIDAVAARIDENDADAAYRASLFTEPIRLAAHIEDALARGGYAGRIAKAAGRGVTKAEILQRISAVRKAQVKPKRDDDRARAEDEAAQPIELLLLPPEVHHTTPAPPPAKAKDSNAPPAPPPPGQAGAKPQSDHDRYAPVRDTVTRAVEQKLPIEQIGQYVAQTMTMSMGYTPFRTPEDLYLVRGSERIQTGLSRPTARFETLLFLASGLTPSRSAHRPYISSIVYFLESGSRRVDDVSWSYVAGDGSVFFPMGDAAGRIIRIGPGLVQKTRMADVRVPAVAGVDFAPIDYVEGGDGIGAVLEAFRWVSISAHDRLVLVYWIVCLPILRRIGTVPIVRIEGGSGSGKTRAIEGIGYLVNGRKGSSVPTAAALVSRMSTSMLTIDDNRETGDVSAQFLGTLLQATHLGAREKRRANSDTGTIIERVCGALVMSGVEAIHDGRPELTSRMLVLQSAAVHRVPDSPVSERPLIDRLLAVRDRFWSESVRRCAGALALDETYGEHLSAEIERAFGATRIGRLSAYLRLMYLAWVAGLPLDRQAEAAESLDSSWRRAFESLGDVALESLLAEELAVSCVRYAMAYGASIATVQPGTGMVPGVGLKVAFDGKFVQASDETYLGPLRATTLARIVREAGKVLNAPPAIAQRLRAGQLEQRLLDGMPYLAAAGIATEVETTQGGKRRFTFRRLASAPPAPQRTGGGDTWQAP
jgi:DNA primase